MKNKHLISLSFLTILIFASIAVTEYFDELMNTINDIQYSIKESQKLLDELRFEKKVLKEEKDHFKEKEAETSSKLIKVNKEINELRNENYDLKSKFGIVATDHLGQDIDLQKYEYIGTFLNGDELYIQPYTYHLQDAAWEMVLVRDEYPIKLFDAFPSRPKFSKDRTKILYIDSLQFEVTGDVAIYDSISMEVTKYTDVLSDEKDVTVKDVEWINDQSVLCIIGFGAGTITQGGHVYQLDLKTKELKRVISDEIISGFTDRPNEVADIDIDENVLRIMLVEWKDDNYLNPYYTSHFLLIDKTDIER